MRENEKRYSNNIPYFLSFLAILVHQSGGTLVIKNLSKFAGGQLSLAMDLDSKADQVTLTVVSNAEPLRK